MTVGAGLPGRSLNLKPNPNQYARKDRPLTYYFDKSGDFYRNVLADFVVEADRRTRGRSSGGRNGRNDLIAERLYRAHEL